jgi:hypothetical protein
MGWGTVQRLNVGATLEHNNQIVGSVPVAGAPLHAVSTVAAKVEVVDS